MIHKFYKTQQEKKQPKASNDDLINFVKYEFVPLSIAIAHLFDLRRTSGDGL